ncbi:MAG: CAP family protein [Putridiphycobacter sp.]
MIFSLSFILAVTLSISHKPVNKTELINRHNYYRKRVGVKPIKYSDECEGSAQAWADYLAKKNKGLSHNSGKFGQNCFWSSNRSNPTQVVDEWAKELKYFNTRKRSYSPKVGHYTQIIWAKTEYVGVGMAIAKDGSEYWVCNYYPAGNYVGEKAY